MPPPSTLIALRTHAWDDGIAANAERLWRLAPGLDFVVAADETNGPVETGPFPKLSHTANFAAFGLPAIPADRVLWWNADYVLYAIRRAFPFYAQYALIEYDVFATADLRALLDACARDGADLVVSDLKPMPEGHWSRPGIAPYSAAPLWAFLPFVVASGHAIDAMLARRREILRANPNVTEQSWPYCEAFLPTAVNEAPGLRVADLDRYVNDSALRYRPWRSTRDPALAAPGALFHPVLADDRFVRAMLSLGNPEALLAPDGRLAPALRHERREVLERVLDTRLQLDEAAATLRVSPEDRIAGAAPGESLRVWDLALRRPCTQSSVSQWSAARTAEADAAHAVCGVLLDDCAFHTGLKDNPWWQVDLGQPCRIHLIEILNRARPAASGRFSAFTILVSGDGAAWQPCHVAQAGTRVSADPARPHVVTLPQPAQARFLRIRQDGAGPMHLRRIRVFGRPDQPAA